MVVFRKDACCHARPACRDHTSEGCSGRARVVVVVAPRMGASCSARVGCGQGCLQGYCVRQDMGCVRV